MGSRELKSAVTRLRRLTPGQEQRLEFLRRIARTLDSAVPVPGTSFRFGLDPILGLIPGVGDLVSPLFTLGIFFQARDLVVPRVVQLRMIFNVAIDVLTGFVPIIGDLFDFAWKANNRNMALLERHAYEEHDGPGHERPVAGGRPVLFVRMPLEQRHVAVVCLPREVEEVADDRNETGEHVDRCVEDHP